MDSPPSFTDFLIKQFPYCTQSPLKRILSPTNHSELRKRCIDELGLDLLSDRCSAAWTCTLYTNKCIGRPIPDFPEVRTLLDKAGIAYSEGLFKGAAVLLITSTVDCTRCPFMEQCTATCASVESYVSRQSSYSSSPKQSKLVNYDLFERGIVGKALTAEDVEQSAFSESWKDSELAWECLSETNQKILRLKYYDGLDDWKIATLLKKQRRDVSLSISRSLSRLSKFSKAIKVIKTQTDTPEYVIEYYLNNQTQKEISRKYQKRQQYVDKIIQTWKKSAGISD